MKKTLIVIGLSMMVSLAIAEFPDINALQNQAASALQNAAQLTALTEFMKNITPIQFQFNSEKLTLNDPHFIVAGYDIDTLMKKVVIPGLSEILNKLPTDKKIAIIGHASQKGSEEATVGFIGNIELSKQRAEAVLAYLKANSTLDNNRFSIIAKGSTAPITGITGKDDKNCRVSFEIQ